VNHAHTIFRLPAPAVSEYCNANVWLIPDPEFGVTETTLACATPVIKDQTVEPFVPLEFFATTIQ
jgi:hypothetical protein